MLDRSHVHSPFCAKMLAWQAQPRRVTSSSSSTYESKFFDEDINAVDHTGLMQSHTTKSDGRLAAPRVPFGAPVTTDMRYEYYEYYWYY